MTDDPDNDGLKVLVVEDDLNFQQLVDLVLSLHDGIAEVRSVDDGRSAISLCEEEFEPDIVLVDLLLPRMSGREVGSRIRKLHPRAKIVSVSGLEEDTATWADEHIVKSGSAVENLKRVVSD